MNKKSHGKCSPWDFLFQFRRTRRKRTCRKQIFQLTVIGFLLNMGALVFLGFHTTHCTVKRLCFHSGMGGNIQLFCSPGPFPARHAGWSNPGTGLWIREDPPLQRQIPSSVHPEKRRRPRLRFPRCAADTALKSGIPPGPSHPQTEFRG